ncbi:beta-lactamase/transpeptidase-like protein [Parathielavia appendiculata]|uniref:Beta-lactamase/transpeptidase-like protein n=1 Tax=Parathielavia appendiculata TaxID=2587402 RepID=A0AAN6UBX7_9PEZI|nr:beta-lactamase/transpeptidase-like protein [Parathielavia appendiculata]
MALRHLVLVAFAGLGLSQNCPIFGPAYPEVPASAPALTAAKMAIQDEIAGALAGGQLDNGTAFGVQVFLRHSDKTLFEYYHGPVGPDTLFRVASISKVIAVYTTLAALGDKHWHDPVTKYIPELAQDKARNPVYDIDWSDVTLGALASHMGGIPRDYALGDLAPYLPEGGPGLPVLNDSEKIQCGTVGLRPCTRDEAFAKITRQYPIAPSDHTPAYSTMAFQLLGYAVEKIAGTRFPSLVQKKLLKPLKLNRTFLTKPNDTKALVLDGWDTEFGDEAPGSGYYSTPSDLTALGRSILSSALLPPSTTRRWLKPVSHTARLSLSIGRPWEIMRLAVPISTTPPLNTTRIVDLYTKQGAMGPYMTLLALSPDYGIGFVVNVGGPSAGATYNLLLEKLSAVWLSAAEQAGREQAGATYAGNYTLPEQEEEGSDVVEVRVSEGEPGLEVSRLVSNGSDVMAVVGGLVGVPQGARVGAWLYPVGLAGGNKIAFRASLGVKGVAVGETCSSWGSLDMIKYGGLPADVFVFELKDGKAVAVEVPVLKKTLRRDGK